jgi:hypothetical protein
MRLAELSFMHDPRRTWSFLGAIGAISLVACAAQVPAQTADSAKPVETSQHAEETAGFREPDLEAAVVSSLQTPPPAVVPEPSPATKPCLADVHVTLGGIILSYAARGSSSRAVHTAVRRMAALHNQRNAESGETRAASGTVRSLALVEDVRGGSRVTLIADDAIDTADLYSHLAADAPDLMPAVSLEQSFCAPPRANSTATIR